MYIHQLEVIIPLFLHVLSGLLYIPVRLLARLPGNISNYLQVSNGFLYIHVIFSAGYETFKKCEYNTSM